ncbi:DUF6465 family protein [Clostridium aestuarii]|uniref:DUF6465 family protein n=1 Tax=Clostridium aestuarii TaxID=338193 RepID=A0ABT4D240_9CLOT|nr:DUF6465 family protein [Clostridium aestuarii]MCY6485314.1 DUF6465 family protein [Clostridium aestuarii]
MKNTVCIQHDGKDITDKQLVSTFRELWKESGRRIKDIKNVNLYFVPSSEKCYWTADTVEGEETGEFQI